MRTNLSAVTALAGSLLLVPVMHGSAQANPLAGVSSNLSSLTLVVDRGDEGARNEGGGPSAGQGNKQHGGNLAEGDEGDHGNRGEDDHGDRDHRVAKHGDHDDNGDHHHRHGHWRGSVWIWDTGPGYASDDCSWLRYRAHETGSPYWWHRYRDCVGY